MIFQVVFKKNFEKKLIFWFKNKKNEEILLLNFDLDGLKRIGLWAGSIPTLPLRYTPGVRLGVGVRVRCIHWGKYRVSIPIPIFSSWFFTSPKKVLLLLHISNFINSSMSSRSDFFTLIINVV